MNTIPINFHSHDWLRVVLAFGIAVGVHAGVVAGVLWTSVLPIDPPKVMGGFEVVDLSAFGVAAAPTPEPIDENTVEKTPPPQEEQEPEPKPEPKPEPEPEPIPVPKPQPEPKPVAKAKPEPQVKKIETPSQPKVLPQTQTAGSQEAFVPPNSTAAYLRNPKPTYPAMAQRRGMEGLVLLYVEVSKHGKPLSVTIKRSSGYALLDKAALRAVQAWHFAPAQRGGIPVSAGVEVPIRFSLQNT